MVIAVVTQATGAEPISRSARAEAWIFELMSEPMVLVNVKSLKLFLVAIVNLKILLTL